MQQQRHPSTRVQPTTERDVTPTMVETSIGIIVTPAWMAAVMLRHCRCDDCTWEQGLLEDAS